MQKKVKKIRIGFVIDKTLPKLGLYANSHNLRTERRNYKVFGTKVANSWYCAMN